MHRFSAMKIKNTILIFFILNLFFILPSYSDSEYFTEGKKFFDQKNYQKSKFLFERDIVFNPKNTKSYLYLAKIFDSKKNDEEQEKNLNTVLLLDPSSEQGLYMLIKLKLSQSDFSKSKELIEQFNLVCSSLCSKKQEIMKKLNYFLTENEAN